MQRWFPHRNADAGTSAETWPTGCETGKRPVMMCAFLNRLRFPGLFVVWLIGAPLHWFLITRLCGWDGTGCDYVWSERVAPLYWLGLQHGTFAASVVGVVFLGCLQLAGQQWRMRYAIAGIAQIVIAAGYITAYNWDWLIGSGSPSDAIQNVGLGIAAVLTLIFVIWRERIASNRADDKLSDSFAERYQNGARLLASLNTIERIAGIRLIEELGRESTWRGRRNIRYQAMCLGLLNQFVNYRRRLGISDPELQAVTDAVSNLQAP